MHEKEAGTILDPLLNEDDEESKEPEADDVGGKIQEMSITVKHTLNCPEGSSSGPIHSVVWEDCEAMEGQEHSVLATGNRSGVTLWDLEQLSVS